MLARFVCVNVHTSAVQGVRFRASGTGRATLLSNGFRSLALDTAWTTLSWAVLLTCALHSMDEAELGGVAWKEALQV